MYWNILFPLLTQAMVPLKTFGDNATGTYRNLQNPQKNNDSVQVTGRGWDETLSVINIRHF
jgi:hypothetical protein